MIIIGYFSLLIYMEKNQNNKFYHFLLTVKIKERKIIASPNVVNENKKKHLFLLHYLSFPLKVLAKHVHIFRPQPSKHSDSKWKIFSNNSF